MGIEIDSILLSGDEASFVCFCYGDVFVRLITILIHKMALNFQFGPDNLKL